MTTLRHGDRSQAVRNLQKQLNQRGAKLVMDGDFGDETEKAVRAFQRTVGLFPDGVAGPDTLAALNGADCKGMINLPLLQAAADRLGVELAAVYAVTEVESLGAGFLPSGKPKILYERHVMYRLLSTPRSKQDKPAVLKARAAELASLYPQLVNEKAGGYVGNEAEHQRLAQAKMIDAARAAESCSWGAFQIMGYHWELLGYASIDDFTARMATSEAEHFEAFVRYIEKHPALHKALKAKKWAEFAQGYNGPAYARNLYDVKLERAYERHQACGCGVAA